MRGLIGKRDVMLHPLTVIQGFGLQVFFKAVLASKGKTFLEIISEGIPQPVSREQIKITLLLDQLIAFELRAAHIYARMAMLYKKHSGAADFFRTISHQEEGHAEILRITKVEVARYNMWASVKPVSQKIIDTVDKDLSTVEWSLRTPGKLPYKKALDTVEELESSEINVVFDFMTHSIQTPFLRKAHRLIPSLAEHHSFLNTVLPELMEDEKRNVHRRKGREV